MARSVRRMRYRLVLPEGPLRRFRLPESFGEDTPPSKPTRPLPWAMIGGWFGVCAGSWVFAQGAWDPIATLDRRWDVPTSEHGVGPTSLAAFAALSVRTPVGATTGQTHAAVAPIVAPAGGRGVTAPTAVQRTSTLPRVEFPEVAVHGGGWGVAQVSGTSQGNQSGHLGETLTPLDDDMEELGSGAVRRRFSREADVAESNSRVGSAPKDAVVAAGASLGETVRELVANTSGLPKPVAHEQDPFEADFGGGSLPSLGAASTSDGPVPLRRQGTPEHPPSTDGSSSPGSRAIAAGRSTTSWNGGCQRVFDGSVQNVGPGPTAKDATSADYTRALSRLNVAGCHPRSSMSIDVCVAVQNGRAAGITVHTTPAASSVGECVASRARAMTFPSSSGVDLVRTQFHVD